MEDIEQYISVKNYDEAIKECIKTNNNYLGLLISQIAQTPCHNLVKQIISNISGIKTEGRNICEIIEVCKDNNPSLLSDEDK